MNSILIQWTCFKEFLLGQVKNKLPLGLTAKQVDSLEHIARQME